MLYYRNRRYRLYFYERTTAMIILDILRLLLTIAIAYLAGKLKSKLK